MNEFNRGDDSTWFTHHDRRMILEIHSMLSDVLRRLDTMNASITDAQSALTALQADVTAQGQTLQSAVTLITGLATALQQEIQIAQQNGLTADQLAGFNSLHDTIVAQTSTLAQAVVTGTAAEGGGAGGTTTIAAPGTGAATEAAAKVTGGKAPTP